MARGFSFLLVLCAAFAQAQTFGRFGYSECHSVPGWILTKEGFRANVSTADTFYFPRVASEWSSMETSSQSQTVSLGDQPDGGPRRLKMDLSCPGFSLYFGDGVDLTLTTTGAPFLSWTEGTVTENVPTPAEPWIVASFSKSQPPVLFSFPDGPQAMIVTGEPGKWHLKSQLPVRGWVRVLLPLGLRSLAPVTAASLGDMSQRVSVNDALWSGPAPTLIERKLSSDAASVTVTWSYDKPGALVPNAALLAGFGGYPLQVTTQITQLDTTSEEGPMAVTKEKDLTIRFLTKEWPSGRFLAVGSPPVLLKDPLDVAGCANLACNVMAAGAPGDLTERAGANLMSYLSSARSELEPNSGRKFPFAASGEGYDLAAAHAFLTQALSDSNETADLPNPLLDDVWARVDSYTWRPWGIDTRRAASLAALAFSMRQEPEQRLNGAMLQAGLSAERGSNLWHYWRGDFTKLPQLFEPMEGLRQFVFGLKGPQQNDLVAQELFGDIRYLSPGGLTAKVNDAGADLSWLVLDPSGGELQFRSKKSLHFSAWQNLKPLKVDHVGDTYTISYTPKDAGFCVVRMAVDGGASLPSLVEPAYSESSR